MIRKIFCALVIFVNLAFSNEHSFKGKHFIASYLGCDSGAISDLNRLIYSMDQAVLSSGATILDKNYYIFPPNGITIVYLLSESHASIHTYPEYGACFVDLFTCGDSCTSDLFHQNLCDFLQPAQVNAHLYLRGEDVEEIPVQIRKLGT